MFLLQKERTPKGALFSKKIFELLKKMGVMIKKKEEKKKEKKKKKRRKEEDN